MIRLFLAQYKKFLMLELYQHSWYPLFLIIGILCFFKGYSIDIKVIIAVSIVISISAIILNTGHFSRFLMMAMLFCCTGYLAAHYRAASLNTFTLQETLSESVIEADIERIEENKIGKRLYLGSLHGNDIPLQLEKVRIISKQKYPVLQIGMRIKCTVTLMPPPESSFPGGFDMKQFLYFKQLGAIGYSTSNIKIVRDVIIVQSWIELLRKIVALRINAAMQQDRAAIASGLLVGDAYAISAKDFEAMRISGTAHLIAISGMHIALIAGIIFLSTRWILIRIEKLAKRSNVKKHAAIIAIIVSYFYLLLAGSPVSAERAFIMSAVVFIAIILDKEVDAMKSLGIAVTIILVLHPENVMSPSLQMSAAACLALIAGFKSSYYLALYKMRNKTAFSRIVIYLLSITFATIMAGAATSIFIAFHFKQFSPYSLLANLLAVPVTDFFIMPCGLIALVLMPLGLEKLPLILMEYGVQLLLIISHWISSFTHASIYVPFFSTTPLIFMVIGLFIICIFQTNLKYIALFCFGYGAFLLSQDKPPIVLISGSGNLFGLYSVQNKVLFLSAKNRERYVQKIWMQNLNAKDKITLTKTGICTDQVCKYFYKNHNIVIVSALSELYSACTDKVSLFINLANTYQCEAAHYNITMADIRKNGAYAIWHFGDRLAIKSVKGGI